MAIFTKSNGLSALLCTLLLAVLVGCGNKGDLFLPVQGDVIQRISTIDDALDELEALEAEEEKEEL